ncbi:MAG: type II secretion system minor pseudopilin GspK [Oleibacter sp.]|nr:type II secretion system minor pseudopilin GspK [Thalassolituus sp.]
MMRSQALPKFRRQRGMVLLMVLLIFSVVAIIATRMIDRQSMDIERSGTMFIQQQSRNYAYASEAAVRQGLYLDWEANPDVDHAFEEWSKDRVFPLDPGSASIHIEDLQGRFNLNSLIPGASTDGVALQRFRNLLNLLGLDLGFAEQWQAWLNPESQADDNYLSLENPYRAAYAACVHTSELMSLVGFDRESYLKIEPYVACLPVTAQLNVNTASNIVLASLDANFSLEDAATVISARGNEGFVKVDDFLGLDVVRPYIQVQPVISGQNDNDAAQKTPWAAADFSVYTEYFETFTRIDLAGRSATTEAVIFRAKDTGKMQTLYRDYSRRKSRKSNIPMTEDTTQEAIQSINEMQGMPMLDSSPQGLGGLESSF